MSSQQTACSSLVPCTQTVTHKHAHGCCPTPGLPQESDWLLRRKTLPIINTVGASVMLLAMGWYWLYFGRRIIRWASGLAGWALVACGAASWQPANTGGCRKDDAVGGGRSIPRRHAACISTA